MEVTKGDAPNDQDHDQTRGKGTFPRRICARRSQRQPAMRFAWGIFTDMLCRDGYITMKQYETWTCPF